MLSQSSPANVEKATRKELSFTLGGEQKLSRLRDKNKKLQLEQPIWTMLLEILDLQDRIAKHEEIEKAGIVDTSNGKIATKIADLKRQKADKEKEVLDKYKNQLVFLEPKPEYVID